MSVNNLNYCKSPPEYTDASGYEQYKQELTIWQLLKACSAEEEGPLIFRTLPSKAKAAVIGLGATAIGSATGLEQILTKLDELYLSDKNQRIFHALDTFEKYRRPANVNMNTFILEFEKLHSKVSDYKCTYPDGVLAYRMLKAANISNEHEQLVRATVETGKWSTKSLKAQLSKVFSDVGIAQPLSAAVKVEPVYHSNVDQGSDPRYDYREKERNSSSATLYDEYGNDELDFLPRENSESFRSSNNDELFDIYYGAPSSDRRSNQWKWKRPDRQTFTRPRGYQKARFVEDPSMRSGLRGSYSSSKTVPNPKDSRGNYTTCRRCRSIYHWVEDCPHLSGEDKSRESKTYYGSSVEEQIYIGLFQSSVPISSDEITCLLGETLGMAVIDSGCPKTVCGQEWFEENLKSSNITDSDLQCLPSKAIFRFGDSDPVHASKKVLLPLNIANKDILLETEVVSSNIPLLLSKDTMKTASAKLNFDKDTITLFGNEQVMVCTSSGHYAIPIKKNSCENEPKEDNEVMQILFTLKEGADVKAVARKLHQQFSHPRVDRLIKFAQKAGVEDESLIEAFKEVDEHCDTCKRYKRKNPRPVVSLPLSSDFNDTIAMDLKIFKNNDIYLMHVIDHLTRFSAGSVIRSKKKEVIVNELFKHWIGVFGCPRRILSDNGGEFANSEFIEMCESLNINFITTAAESPFSNGLVEKHNDIIGEAIQKILDDVDCSIEVAFCWALNAKNSLQNIHGFSSYQLVFGQNPNLPSVFENKLPALEGVTSSKLIASHLNALHKGREEFVKLEASEKMRRAMRSKTRTHSNITYYNGDEVFYKREGEKRWRGPGRVIGQDGSKLLIKIPTGLITAHSCSVILASDSEKSSLNVEETVIEDDINLRNIAQRYEDDEVWFDAQDRLNEDTLNREVQHNELDSDILPEHHDNILTDQLHNQENEIEHQFDQLQNQENEIEDQLDQHIPNETEAVVEDIVSDIQTVADLPKIHQCFQYCTQHSNEWENAKVIGRAGKVNGVNKFWLNIKNLDTEVESALDFKNTVAEWRPLEHQVMLSSLKDDKYADAKEKELANWNRLQVYEEVIDEGQKFISARWVYTEKEIDGERVKKARLVCRGFEEESNVPTDSPTCGKDTLRIGISVISSMEWEINSTDIKAAFLNGKDLERVIFMKPPKEANVPGRLWKLRRCVYGLNDASRYWYFRLREELINLGCKCSNKDPSLFIYHQNSRLHGIMMIHVDDILWAGSEQFVTKVIDQIRATFKISSECRSAFKYVGLEINQTKEGIYLSQKQYASEIEEVKIDNHRKKNLNLPLTDEETSELRAITGKLNWLATETRPDLAFTVSQLGSSRATATVKTLIKANKIVRRVKQHDTYMFFPKMDVDKMKVRCYADASHNKFEDGGSQGGIFIEIVCQDKTSPASWNSKRIKRIVRSALAAETLAMAQAVEAGYLVSAILSDILYEGKQKISVEAITDSYSLYESAHSTKSVEDRKLRVDLGIIRDHITDENLTLNWVPTSSQLSDVLTKEGVDPSALLSHITS